MELPIPPPIQPEPDRFEINTAPRIAPARRPMKPDKLPRLVLLILVISWLPVTFAAGFVAYPIGYAAAEERAKQNNETDWRGWPVTIVDTDHFEAQGVALSSSVMYLTTMLYVFSGVVCIAWWFYARD